MEIFSYGGLAQEVSEKKNFSMLPRDHACDILVKMAAFCPCPKSLPEAKVKRFRLISLAKEISKQFSILNLCIKTCIYKYKYINTNI